MHDEAAVYANQVVGAHAPEPYTPADDCGAQRGPVRPRLQRDCRLRDRRIDPTQPAEGVSDDLLFVVMLGRHAHVLPLAATASFPDMRAGRRHPDGGILQYLLDPGGGVAGMFGLDASRDQLSGKGALHEDGPSRRLAAHSSAIRGHGRRRQLH